MSEPIYEHHQHFVCSIVPLPQRVGPGDMGLQYAHMVFGTGGGIQVERHLVRHQFAVLQRDQRAQRMSTQS